tara:strand:- start:272 stop:490 length:219 start_codon:yes stop_codon:yes gene_type:complete
LSLAAVVAVGTTVAITLMAKQLYTDQTEALEPIQIKLVSVAKMAMVLPEVFLAEMQVDFIVTVVAITITMEK